MHKLLLYSIVVLAFALYLWALAVLVLTRQTLLLCGFTLGGSLASAALLFFAYRHKKRLFMAMALVTTLFSVVMAVLSLFNTL